VVGVEHTDAARNAVEWAADLAAAWRAPVDLVHVQPDSRQPTAEEPCWLGQLWVDVWRAGAEPGTVETVAGEPVEQLTARSAGARLLVVGGDGAGAGPLVRGMLERASYPVAVVRGSSRNAQPRRTGPVVVGTDGSPSASAALWQATVLASALGAELVVVHSWADDHADATEVLLGELDLVRAGYPGLPVTTSPAGRPLTQALRERADHARMLVIGHGEPGSTPGAIARELPGAAACPVVVSRPVPVDPGAEIVAAGAAPHR
jgi:nucleotide-binding universal stress UspA family protein